MKQKRKSQISMILFLMGACCCIVGFFDQLLIGVVSLALMFLAKKVNPEDFEHGRVQ